MTVRACLTAKPRLTYLVCWCLPCCRQTVQRTQNPCSECCSLVQNCCAGNDSLKLYSCTYAYMRGHYVHGSGGPYLARGAPEWEENSDSPEWTGDILIGLLLKPRCSSQHWSESATCRSCRAKNRSRPRWHEVTHAKHSRKINVIGANLPEGFRFGVKTLYPGIPPSSTVCRAVQRCRGAATVWN